MIIRNLVLTLLMAVAIWSISFFIIHWPEYKPLPSLLVSILGALVVAGILLILAKYFSWTISQDKLLLLVGAGAVIGVWVGSIILASINVSVTCNQPPAANPDEVRAYPGDKICWLPTTVGYTVEFKQSNIGDPGNGGRRSPVKKLTSSGEEISIPVGTSFSSSRTVDVQQGYYWYNITCDNGYSIDPKVKVPPR